MNFGVCFSLVVCLLVLVVQQCTACEREQIDSIVQIEKEILQCCKKNDMDHSSTKREIENLITTAFNKVEAKLTKELTNQQTLINELKTVVQTCSTQKAEPSCPSGTTKFGTSCYHLNKERLDWQSAVNKCKAYAHGGCYLVHVDNSAENDYLKTYYPLSCADVPTCAIWVGASDSAKEGQYIAAKDNQPIPFSDWLTGEPNGGARENCIHLDNKGGRIGWNDITCSYTLMSMCECPMG